MAEEEVKKAEGAAGAEGEDGAAAAGGKKKKLLMLVCGGVAVLGLLIGGGVFFMLHKSAPKEDAGATVTASFYDVPQFAVNLLSEGDEQHFLKLKVALELTKATDAANVDKLLPRLQDDFQAFLRQMRVDDLRGSAALARLKDALLLRANQVLAPVAVKDVLFREVLVQ